MNIRSNLSCRTAIEADRHRIAHLIQSELYVHRHLDWRAPLDWIGRNPYLIVENNSNILAALASPPDPPEVAWIRLFAVSSKANRQEVWSLSWEIALAILLQNNISSISALPLDKWFQDLLTASGFQQTNKVVMLEWDRVNSSPIPPVVRLQIRPMLLEDLITVADIDARAFGLIWQNSLDSLELAYQQASIATLGILNGKPIGYQMSTTTQTGGHLARLAILPEYQGNGYGYEMLCDLLERFKQRGAMIITVNTQADNLASISLYQKAGFHMTGETFPVYQFMFSDQT